MRQDRGLSNNLFVVCVGACGRDKFFFQSEVVSLKAGTATASTGCAGVSDRPSRDVTTLLSLRVDPALRIPQG